MSVKRRRKILVIVILCVLMVGMCFDGVETDSFLAYDSLLESRDVLKAVDSAAFEPQAVTPRMIQIREINGNTYFSGAVYGHKRELRILSEFIPMKICLPEQSILIFCAFIAVLQSVDFNKRIAIFVHRADGKKRVKSAG